MCALTQVDTASQFEAALIGVNMLVVVAGLGLCIYCAVEEKFRYLGSDTYRQSCDNGARVWVRVRVLGHVRHTLCLYLIYVYVFIEINLCVCVCVCVCV